MFRIKRNNRIKIKHKQRPRLRQRLTKVVVALFYEDDRPDELNWTTGICDFSLFSFRLERFLRENNPKRRIARKFVSQRDSRFSPTKDRTNDESKFDLHEKHTEPESFSLFLSFDSLLEQCRPREKGNNFLVCLSSFYVRFKEDENLTAYASGMLMNCFVRATCPAMPLPNGITICWSSRCKDCSKVDPAVTSNNLETRYRQSLGPRARNKLPRSEFVKMETLVKILWETTSTLSSFEMSRISSKKSSFSFRFK